MKTLSFEEAFTKLEEILQKMNTGKVPLEEALQLFEEGNELLKLCQHKLQAAEQKIEMLIKNREGKIDMSPEKEVKKVSFAEETSLPKFNDLPF